MGIMFNERGNIFFSAVQLPLSFPSLNDIRLIRHVTQVRLLLPLEMGSGVNVDSKRLKQLVFFEVWQITG